MAKSFVFHFENTAKPSFDYTSSLLKPSYTTKHYRESGLRSRSRSREYESPSYKSNYQKNKGYHKEDSPRKGGFVYEFPSKLDNNEKYSHEYRNKPYKERERERSPRRKSRFHFHSDSSDSKIDREFEDAVEAFMQSEKKRNEMIESGNPSNSSKIEVERLNQPLDELEEKIKAQSASGKRLKKY